MLINMMDLMVMVNGVVPVISEILIHSWETALSRSLEHIMCVSRLNN